MELAPQAGYALAFYPDLSLHGFDQVFADIQAQATATCWACQILWQARKLLEEQDLLLWWNACPSITDGDANLAAIGTCFNKNGAHVGGVFEGVGEQVIEDMAYAVGIPADKEVARDAGMHPVMALVQHLKLGDCIIHNTIEL